MKRSFPAPSAILSRLAPGALLLLPLAAPAQMLVDIQPCVELADPVARFGCYEDLARQATALTEQAPAVSADPAEARASQAPVEQGRPAVTVREAQPALPAPTASAQPASGVSPEAPGRETAGVAGFGRNRNEEPRIEQAEVGGVLVDTVAELSQFRPNQWTVTLASGQVWRQMLPKRFFLREGSEVRIAPSRWGESYRLTSEGLAGFIQVERIDRAE